MAKESNDSRRRRRSRRRNRNKGPKPQQERIPNTGLWLTRVC